MTSRVKTSTLNVRPILSDDEEGEYEEEPPGDKTVADVFRAWLVQNPSVPSNAVDSAKVPDSDF